MKELFLNCPHFVYYNNKFWFVNASFPGLFSVDKDSLQVDSYGFPKEIEDNIEAGWYGIHFIEGESIIFLPTNAEDIVVFNTCAGDFDRISMDSNNDIVQTIAAFDDRNAECIWACDESMRVFKIWRSPLRVSYAPEMSSVFKSVGKIRSTEKISNDEIMIVTTENKLFCISLRVKETKEIICLGNHSNHIQHVRFDGKCYWMTFSDSCEVWKWDVYFKEHEVYQIDEEIEWDTRTNLRIPFSDIRVYEDIVVLTNFRLQHIYYIDKQKKEHVIRKLFEYPRDFRYVDDYFANGHSNYASCYRLQDSLYFLPMSGGNMMLKYNVKTKELIGKLFCIDKDIIKGYEKILYNQVRRGEVWREREDFSVEDVVKYMCE